MPHSRKHGPGRIYEQKQNAYFKYVCTAFGILRGGPQANITLCDNDIITYGNI